MRLRRHKLKLERTPMEPIYIDHFTISDLQTDRYGRLKPSAISWFVQEIAGRHCIHLGTEWDTLAAKGMFWAIIRHRVQVNRLPQKGETIRIETWPMPTTRVAYPRNVVAFDAAGQELFRTTSLWVLMDLNTRAMILPGKSGVTVEGILRGGELPQPASLAPAELAQCRQRTVYFTDLDINGHMNNCRYLDWAWDLLPSDAHGSRSLQQFTLCYLNEAIEGQTLQLHHADLPDGHFRLEITRQDGEEFHRIFSADLQYN